MYQRDDTSVCPAMTTKRWTTRAVLATATVLMLAACTPSDGNDDVQPVAPTPSQLDVDVNAVIEQVVGQGDFALVDSEWTVAELANAVDPSWRVTEEQVLYYEQVACQYDDLQPIYDFVIDDLPGADERMIPVMNKMVAEAAVRCGGDPWVAQANLALDLGRAQLPEHAAEKQIDLVTVERQVCHAINVAGNVTEAAELLDAIRGAVMTRLAALITVMNDVCAVIKSPLEGFLQVAWRLLTK